jgi:hypothetical protein
VVAIDGCRHTTGQRPTNGDVDCLKHRRCWRVFPASAHRSPGTAPLQGNDP